MCAKHLLDLSIYVATHYTRSKEEEKEKTLNKNVKNAKCQIEKWMKMRY